MYIILSFYKKWSQKARSKLDYPWLTNSVKINFEDLTLYLTYGTNELKKKSVQ
jgi:hypothetical protein